MGQRAVSVGAGERTRVVTVQDEGSVVVDDVSFHVSAAPSAGEVIVSNGVSTERVFLTVDGDTVWAFHDGEAFELSVDAEGTAHRRAHHTGSLTAPMPATVVSIHARPGDRVTRGAILIVLEAMKMELPVRAPADGVVTVVNCKPGDLVQPGVPLIELQ